MLLLPISLFADATKVTSAETKYSVQTYQLTLDGAKEIANRAQEAAKKLNKTGTEFNIKVNSKSRLLLQFHRFSRIMDLNKF